MNNQLRVDIENTAYVGTYIVLSNGDGSVSFELWHDDVCHRDERRFLAHDASMVECIRAELRKMAHQRLLNAHHAPDGLQR